jgi:ribose transport system substrate-binding protein
MRHPGQIIDSGSFVVTKADVGTYDTARKAKTEQLKKQFADTVLTCK